MGNYARNDIENNQAWDKCNYKEGAVSLDILAVCCAFVCVVTFYDVRRELNLIYEETKFNFHDPVHKQIVEDNMRPVMMVVVGIAMVSVLWSVRITLAWGDVLAHVRLDIETEDD